MALVVVLHLLLLSMLFRLVPPAPGKKQPLVTIVDLIPAAPVAPTRTRTEERRQDQGTATRKEAAPTATVLPEKLPPPASSIWSQVIPLTREQMASADLARFPPSRAAEKGSDLAEASTNGGGETDDATGPGAGPNGETLYNARWYRRPTDAELGFYLPPGRPRTGWGMIACQTVAAYRVENCQEIAQSPAGSGLAGAVRQAAWQFRVLPPRIGGKVMVGAWVRIRIDYTISGTK
nr:H365 [uncultured bacterium]